MIDAAQVKKEIAATLKKPVEKLGDDVALTDLVQESFALVEMVIDLQETFSVRFGQEDLNAVKTVGDLVRLIRSRAQG
jgi:acyl carrier protein